MSVHYLLPDLGGWLLIPSFGLLFAISGAGNRFSYNARLAMLLGFGFIQGWEIGPLVHNLWEFDPEAVMMALIGATLAFISFSCTALFSERRSYLYLGGLLGTLSLLSLVSSFFGGLFNFNLFLGLFIFCFYIIYDTQLLVERAENGDRDDIQGAATLFTDIFAAFVRLLLILQRRDKEKKKERKGWN